MEEYENPVSGREASLDMTSFIAESDRLRDLSCVGEDENEDAMPDGSCLYVPLPKEELSSFSVGAKNRRKETFYCELCEVELNSRNTMKSHALGARHLEEKKKICRQMLGSGEAGEELVIRQIPNPEPIRKKVPVRLQAKLRETSEPVVGLEAVAEFIPISNKEMEPYYECHLCNNIGEANAMFNHVLRTKHQQAFIDKKFPNDPRLVDLRGPDLRHLVRRFSELDLLRTYPKRLVRTYESDLMYPWPQGKAPWCVEQGGDGWIPDNARSKIVAISPETWEKDDRFKIWRRLEEDKAAAFRSIRCNLSDPSQIAPPRDDREAEVCAQWVSDLCHELTKVAEDGFGRKDGGKKSSPSRSGSAVYHANAACAAAIRVAMELGDRQKKKEKKK